MKMIKIVQIIFDYLNAGIKNEKAIKTKNAYAINSVFFLFNLATYLAKTIEVRISALPRTRLSTPKLKPISSIAY